MLNQYPAWKNALVLVVVLLGFLYSIPNIYPDDEAIQVSTDSLSLNESDMALITTALEAAQVEFFGEEVSEENILIRLNSVDDQLVAKTAIEDALSDDYIVALNLAPTTPGWLQAIGAGKMNLGLDLQGGVHFLMEVDMDAALGRRMEDNLSNVRSILREERLRTRGTEVVDNNHLEIRFANTEIRSDARSELIDNFPDLQFQTREVGDLFILDMRTPAEVALQVERDTLQANRTTIMNRVDSLGVAEPTVQQQGADRIVVELPGIQDPAQAIRFLQRIATLEFHLEAEPGASAVSYESYEYQGQLIDVDNEVILQGDRISNVRSTLDQNGLPQVQINLDAQGGNQINRVTRDNVGRMMDILLSETKSRTITTLDEDGNEIEDVEFYEDKRLISHATIITALPRTFVITGLNAREANDFSVIPATLTLPGIVGIVLTVGMAVDANVLIFTRIREELSNGMSPQQAIDAGYDRAFTTILDANLTTFLVALVLFTIGTGPVKGFAVTLMIGIITSMFTAIVGTRALVNLIYGGRSVQQLSIGKYRMPDKPGIKAA